MKAHPTIGCCGIDCGLCPRYYTAGSSRCPGCGGEEFEQRHPPCGFFTCCAKKRILEACAQCGDFPCARFDKEDGTRDSFVTHRRVLTNQAQIREIGLEAFLEQQRERMDFLEKALSEYDDGRSKSLFCLAAALLSIEGLRAALRNAEAEENLKTALIALADREGEELKLRK